MLLGSIWESATSLCMNYNIHCWDSQLIHGVILNWQGNSYRKTIPCLSQFRTLPNIFDGVEVVVQGCSVTQVFLEISQKSHENTCARVSFLITLQTSGLKFQRTLFTQNTSGGCLWWRSFAKIVEVFTEYLLWNYCFRQSCKWYHLLL